MFYYMRPKYKKGETLAETVVAIAVVMIISTAVITGVMYASLVSKKNSDKIFYTTVIRSFADCYLYDGFVIDDKFDDTLLSFYFDKPFYYKMENNDSNKEYYFYYDSERKIIDSEENLSSVKIIVKAILSQDNSFIAESYYAKDESSIYVMENSIHRAK